MLLTSSFPTDGEPFSLLSHSAPALAPNMRQELERLVNWSLTEQAYEKITAWRGYGPTPLVDMPGLAGAASVAKIHCKYEGERFGIGSFKALGGAYAVTCAVSELAACELPGSLTVATASDGNHGLSVAWGAQQAGCRCVVFLHRNVSAGRRELIERMGARTVRVEGNYDDSTRIAAQVSEENGWTLVADTSTSYERMPILVMAGYGVMVRELLDQYEQARQALPTHVFIQGGCGGLAASVVGLLQARLGQAMPRVVIVEPEHAACLYASSEAGRPTVVKGDLQTVMAGLAVGEVSALAWPILQHYAHGFIKISDDAAIAAMRMLAHGSDGDSPLAIGDAGVGGLAGLLLAAGNTQAREILGLSPDSRILVIGTEGPVDRPTYDRLISGTRS